MARWTAGAKWADGPAPDGQCDMPLALRLSEGLGLIAGRRPLPPSPRGSGALRGYSASEFEVTRGHD